MAVVPDANGTNLSNQITSRYVRNFPFPESPWFIKENIESALDYQSRDGDIIVSSYPKTGTTWLQYIVWQILHKCESYPGFDDLTYRLAPFVEIAGAKAVDGLPDPRFYKNHLPYHMININKNAKYMYIYRDPKDTVVSYYHFYHALRPEKNVDFDEFFNGFLDGRLPYGNFFDHVLSFLEHEGDENLLIISYEDLHANTKQEILRIAKFLGDDYYSELCKNVSLLNKILEVTSFDYMKTHLASTYPRHKINNSNNGPVVRSKPVNFFRKGVVGEGKACLSQQQKEKLREVVLDKMKDTKFVDLWCIW